MEANLTCHGHHVILFDTEKPEQIFVMSSDSFEGIIRRKKLYGVISTVQK